MTTSNSPSARKTALAIAASTLLIGMLLSGCSGDDGAAGGWSRQANEAVAMTGMADGAISAEFDFADEAPASAPQAGRDANAYTTREIITRGNATVVVDDPLDVASRLAAEVERIGGHIESRNETQGTADTRPSAWLVLRIPSAQMSATLDNLASFGEVRNVNVSREDVTAQGADLDARIDALNASITRLTALMNEATNVEDLLNAERELTWRQADLDGLRAQRNTLTDQVRMSTLHVSLHTEAEVGATRPGGFLGGLQNGWDALLRFGSGTLVTIGAVLPWLTVAAVVALCARITLRHRRRNHPTPPTDPPTPTDPHLPEPN
ncbi:MAG: DUF4349 domain-containing protein [Promicromonosporaceae bacterium]|nr:DUF4349 domain-containing protein [Promicromonosporaceae bacterium]